MKLSQALKRIYESNHMISGDGNCIVVEKSNTTPSTLQSVTFENCGEYVLLKECWLNDGKDRYRNLNGICRLKKICEGVLYLEKDNHKYIFIIEMKSSKNQVFKDAIFKFTTCYYRTRMCINTIDGVNLNDIEMVGIIAYSNNSAIEKEHPKIINRTLIEDKKTFINNQIKEEEKLIRKYSALLVENQVSYLCGHDFGVDTLPLKAEYKMESLKTILYPVSCPQGTIDMNKIIKMLNI